MSNSRARTTLHGSSTSGRSISPLLTRNRNHVCRLESLEAYLKETIGASSLDDIAEALADPTIINDMQRDLPRLQCTRFRAAVHYTPALNALEFASTASLPGDSQSAAEHHVELAVFDRLSADSQLTAELQSRDLVDFEAAALETLREAIQQKQATLDALRTQSAQDVETLRCQIAMLNNVISEESASASRAVLELEEKRQRTASKVQLIQGMLLKASASPLTLSFR